MNQEHVDNVCRIGQGEACCAYLMMGNGFECGKGGPADRTIRSRLKAGTMTAKGDNCSGHPDFVATAVD